MNKPQPNYLDVVKKEDLSIAYLWTHFAGLVLPNAPEAQRQEMRKAFYAGFIECFKIVNDVATLPEPESYQMLEKLNAEGREFFEKLMTEHGLKR